MRFSEWIKLKETGTGTSSVAVFARPAIQDVVQRNMFEPLILEDEKCPDCGGKMSKKNGKLVCTKCSKGEAKFSKWFGNKLNEDYPVQQQQSVAQTLPQGNAPSGAIQQHNQAQQGVSVNPTQYKGRNTQLYNQIYQKFKQTGDQVMGKALHQAIQGDEHQLQQFAQQQNQPQQQFQP